LNKKIKEYIDKQPSPQKEILLRVREIFLETLPGCKEKMSWGVVVFGDGKFYIASMKTRVHVGFAITGLSKEEIKLFEGSGKTMRHVKIHSLDDIDKKQLVQLIKMVDKKSTCIHH
jgi:hypothetical protein